MKKIQNLVDQIKEELEDAKNYAETYLDLKARGQTAWANKYKGMAEDEVRHSQIAHDHAVEEIGLLSKVYTPPAEMEEKWNMAHKEYVEKAAWVKQMLTM